MNNNDDDYSDLVCALCRTGGDMICCDGRCLRSFHPKCIGVKEEDIPEDSPFVCSDCFSGVQRCFVCSHFGIENELVKCSVEYCGKFYHPECVGTTVLKSDSYVCKLHSCDSCGEVVTNPIKRNTLWRCFRCPKAFDTKHRPRDVHVLAEGVFLCIRHTQEEEVWPEMSKKLAERLQLRNQQSLNSNNFTQQSNVSINRNISLTEKKTPSSLSTAAAASASLSLAQLNRGLFKPGETIQQRDRRLKEEEKERLDHEATIRASTIMPKKRQSTELENNSDNGHEDGNGNEYDENTPRFSPTSVDGNEYDDNGKQFPFSTTSFTSSSSSPSPISNYHNLNTTHLSHLARHNEYRRQRKGLWNQSWNQYRDIQDEMMGIRRRDDLRGYYYYEDNNNNNYQQAMARNSSEFSFMTSFLSPEDSGSSNNTTMNRTNKLLSSATLSSSSPSLSSSSSFSMNQPTTTAVLMRTNALLTQLSNTNQTQSQSHDIKRLKYDHTHNYSSSSSSSLSSGIIPSRMNGSHTSPVVLSRTEQLLASSSSSSSSSFPSSSSSNIKPVLSRTEQMLAMTSSSSSSSSSLSSRSHPTQSSTRVMHQPHQSAPSHSLSSSNQPSSSSSKLKDTKMDATDLFAMLQASGLLPTKK